MKIFLVIEDRKDRSTILVSGSLKVCPLQDAAKLVRDNVIDGLHVMRRCGREYLRKDRANREVFAVEAVSISFFALFGAVNSPSRFIARSGTKQF